MSHTEHGGRKLIDICRFVLEWKHLTDEYFESRNRYLPGDSVSLVKQFLPVDVPGAWLKCLAAAENHKPCITSSELYRSTISMTKELNVLVASSDELTDDVHQIHMVLQIFGERAARVIDHRLLGSINAFLRRKNARLRPLASTSAQVCWKVLRCALARSRAKALSDTYRISLQIINTETVNTEVIEQLRRVRRVQQLGVNGATDRLLRGRPRDQAPLQRVVTVTFQPLIDALCQCSAATSKCGAAEATTIGHFDVLMEALEWVVGVGTTDVLRYDAIFTSVGWTAALVRVRDLITVVTLLVSNCSGNSVAFHDLSRRAWGTVSTFTSKVLNHVAQVVNEHRRRFKDAEEEQLVHFLTLVWRPCIVVLLKTVNLPEPSSAAISTELLRRAVTSLSSTVLLSSISEFVVNRGSFPSGGESDRVVKANELILAGKVSKLVGLLECFVAIDLNAVTHDGRWSPVVTAVMGMVSSLKLSRSSHRENGYLI